VNEATIRCPQEIEDVAAAYKAALRLWPVPASCEMTGKLSLEFASGGLLNLECP
jgi:hypothetical protein